MSEKQKQAGQVRREIRDISEVGHGYTDIYPEGAQEIYECYDAGYYSRSWSSDSSPVEAAVRAVEILERIQLDEAEPGTFEMVELTNQQENSHGEAHRIPLSSVPELVADQESEYWWINTVLESFYWESGAVSLVRSEAGDPVAMAGVLDPFDLPEQSIAEWRQASAVAEIADSEMKWQ